MVETSFTGKLAQDLAAVTFIDSKKLVAIKYKEGVADPEDIETPQDMTTQAINDALSQIDEATKETMGAFADKLPFQKSKMDWQYRSTSVCHDITIQLPFMTSMTAKTPNRLRLFDTPYLFSDITCKPNPTLL